MDNKDKFKDAGLTRRQLLAAAPASAIAASGLLFNIEELLRGVFASGNPLAMSSSLGRIYLSGIGWIDDVAPRGVRLRWLYPIQLPGSPNYMGFPQAVHVERATPPEFGPFPTKGTIDAGMEPAVGYPTQWWKPSLAMKSVSPAIFRPRNDLSVQAVTFVYQGPDTRCRLRDSSQCALGEFPVQNGNRVYFEAGDIAEIEFLSDDARKIHLTSDFSLNLFIERHLEWQSVATISVRTPLLDRIIGDFDLITSRVYGQGTLKKSDWTDIQKFAAQADAIHDPSNDPYTSDPSRKSPIWDTWFILQSLRWEIAVLTGFGFVHGPNRQMKPVNGDTVSIPLPSPPGVPTAYRIGVVPQGGATATYSNLVLIPPGIIPRLKPPDEFKYNDCISSASQLVKDNNPPNAPTVRSVYVGAGSLVWSHTKDPWAMGVEVVETISASALKGGQTATTADRINARIRSGLDRAGKSSRRFELAFPDCKLNVTAKTFDAWDRYSVDEQIPPVSFSLSHSPTAPGLACASYDPDSQKVTIERLVGKPSCMTGTGSYADWSPDEIVKTLAGQVELARRVRDPISQAVKLTDVSVVALDTYEVRLAEPLPKGAFVGGRLIANGLANSITELSDDRLILRVSSMDGARSQVEKNFQTVTDQFCESVGQPPKTGLLYSPGPATVVEDLSAPELWAHVNFFDVTKPFPPVIVFPESSPMPTDGTDSLVYSLRVGFNKAGQTTFGTYGNSVSAFRKSRPPVQPPPFTVQMLGRDYFRRLVINVTLTKDQGAVFYVVAWARGYASDWQEGGASGKNSKPFAAAGIGGVIGRQTPHQGKFLYELLEVPDPSFLDIPMTIGVKRIDSIGQESPYTLEDIVIPAG